MRLAVSICQTFGDTMNYLNGQCRGTTKLRDNVPTSRLRTRSAITTTTIINSGSKVSTIHPSISMTTGDQCPLSNYYLWVQWTSTYHLEGLNVNIHTSTFDERVGVKRERERERETVAIGSVTPVEVIGSPLIYDQFGHTNWKIWNTTANLNA